MRNFWILLKRELAAVFLTPVAYVTMAVFFSASAWTFLATVKVKVGTAEYLEPQLFSAILLWLPMLITVICMRLFAEEKRTGTIETLMTTAVGETSVVLAKYAGALLFCWICVVPVVAVPYILVEASPGLERVDQYALIGGGAMVVLISFCCTSIGVLTSLLTRNQIVAALCCFWAILAPFMVHPLMTVIPFFRQATIERFSMFQHVMLFVSGTLSLQPVVLYLSVTVLMLFSAIRVLESRRWL